MPARARGEWLNRLTSVNYGDGQTQGYTFDPMGNRLTKTDSQNGNESYAYNNANMLLTRNANNYTNDSDGNTLTGGGRTNVWDSQNRLAQCTFSGTTSSFVYAADGIRHQSVVGANTTDYVLDSSMFVRENRNGILAATYLVGPRGPEYRRDDQAGTIRWHAQPLSESQGRTDRPTPGVREPAGRGGARTVLDRIPCGEVAAEGPV